jgi:hypothetical protein
MGELEFSTVADAIFNTATGSNLTNSSKVRDVHGAMLRIMTALSSYSIQYIEQINDSPIKIVDGKFPKLSLIQEDSISTYEVETPAPTIVNLLEIDVEYLTHLMPYPRIDMEVKDIRALAKVPADVSIRLTGMIDHLAQIDLPLPEITMIQNPQTDISSITQSDVAGYLTIPPQELSGLVSGNTLTGYDLLTDARRKIFLGI